MSGVRPRMCAVDGWLTLNGAARAEVPEPGRGPCPAGLAVVPRSGLVAAGCRWGHGCRGWDGWRPTTRSSIGTRSGGCCRGRASPGTGRGAVTAVGPAGGVAARRAALGRDDAELGAIRAGVPAGTTLMVIAPGDGAGAASAGDRGRWARVPGRGAGFRVDQGAGAGAAYRPDSRGAGVVRHGDTVRRGGVAADQHRQGWAAWPRRSAC